MGYRILADALVVFHLAFLMILGVFLLNMTFAPKISAPVLFTTRVLLVAFFGAAILWFRIRNQKNARRLAFILMTVNLAFLVVSFFTTGLWGIDLQTARGIAFTKLSDSVICTFTNNKRMLHLQKKKKIPCLEYNKISSLK